VAQWQTPGGVDAPDPDAAPRRAHRDWGDSGKTIHVHDDVGVTRFEELKRRPRPGSPEFTSIVAMWIGKEQSASNWEMWTSEPYRQDDPSACFYCEGDGVAYVHCAACRCHDGRRVAGETQGCTCGPRRPEDAVPCSCSAGRRRLEAGEFKGHMKIDASVRRSPRR
jgi:hypothetical protein